jgi:carbamoyltransferase
LKPNGRFALNLDYFLHHTEGVDYSFDGDGKPTVAPLYSKKFIDKFGEPTPRYGELTQRNKDLARSLQACLERAYLHMLNHLAERTRLRTLGLAGGVALNSVANGMIFDETPFERIYVQPAAGDDGTAVGAAYYVYHHELGRPRGFVMDHAYTGCSYDEKAVAAAAASSGLTFERPPDERLYDETAKEIAAGKIVGWFQGAMEWGPRALGNRSIVAHPGLPDMKDILNARIKHREWFRPFAPSILAERCGEYFEQTHPSPFMLLVYKTKPAVRERIQAVNHVDDTGRLQTVERSQNPRYYDLICAFERQTGTPVVLNTSFNENEPIVCTPQEAIDCFTRTNMDTLVLGNHFCRRKGS